MGSAQAVKAQTLPLTWLSVQTQDTNLLLQLYQCKQEQKWFTGLFAVITYAGFGTQYI